MTNLEDQQRQLARRLRPRGQPVGIVQGVVEATNSDGTIDVNEDGSEETIPSVDLLGATATSEDVWMLRFGDGDRLALGTPGNGDVTLSVAMHDDDISATGPGPDVWPIGIRWAKVSSSWTGRPGAANGILVSYNGGNFIPSYQTYFTGTTMYVRNRDTATAWGAWRTAWGPV